MADVNFIDFKSEPYFIERTSIYTSQYKVRGIQLLPNNTLPYIQTTNVSAGIYLEDWEAFIVDTCGNETDISDYFVIEDVFTDDNGDNQFTWSLTNVPFDFGYDLVYIKVSQLVGETFCSNYFMLTDVESDKTCRIDYKSINADTMQSIQLQMAFKQELKTIELTNYYETSTRNTVTNVVKSQRYENWLTQIISNDLLLKIIDVFGCKYVYINLLRCNLFEAIDIKEYEAEENFNENLIKIAFNKSDVYNPLEVAVTPSVPEITLTSVIANGVNATYTFNYANFVPTYLVYEYSDDEVTWNSTNGVITSPKSISFAEVGTWYFRIKHPEAISNTITLNLGDTVNAVNDVVSTLKGSTIDLDVLFNDTLVGATTITAVSTATNGTVSIIESGTKVRYIHDDSSTTTDSFTYTISNGVTSDTATVSLNIYALTSFLMNFISGTTKTEACAVIFGGSTFYYETTLSIGGRVYIEELDGIRPYNGNNKWYQISGGRAIKIDTLGYIIDKGVC